MVKRLGVLGAVIAVVAVLVSMVAPAGAGDGNNGKDKVTLRLAEKLTDDEQFITDVDVGEDGFSVGDSLILFDDPVFNRALTKQVGTFEGDCVVVDVDGPTFECDLTAFLPGGLLTVEGPFDFSAGEAEWAVTGGTDKYKTAHGELHLDFSDGETNFLTFKLVL
jgi:hypothetical protein